MLYEKIWKNVIETDFQRSIAERIYVCGFERRLATPARVF